MAYIHAWSVADGDTAALTLTSSGSGATLKRALDVNIAGGSEADTPTAISDGNKTVTTAGSSVKLITADTPCKVVVITALLANTGLISVGGSTTSPTATVRGDILAAGDSSVVSISNVNLVYINSTVNSEGVSFRYQT